MQKFIISIFICLTICACSLNVFYYHNVASSQLALSSIGNSFSLSLDAGEIELTGVLSSGTHLDIKYRERTPQDIKFVIKQGRLAYISKSGNPPLIESVKGSLPSSTSLFIECGAGHVNISGFSSRRMAIAMDMGRVNLSHISRVERLDIEINAGELNAQEIADIKTFNCQNDTGKTSISNARLLRNVYVEGGLGAISINDAQIDNATI